MLIPRKLIDHEFYLLHFLVPASPLIGGVFMDLMNIIRVKRDKIVGGFTVFFILISFIVSMRYAAHPAFKSTEEDRAIPQIANNLKEITDKEKDKLITQGTINLLYYADRYGWPFVIERNGEVSDYYKYTNWEKLSEEQRSIRNEALKSPISNLEYLRRYDGATHFVVTNPKEFYRHPDFAKHLQKNYKIIREEKGFFILFNLSQ